ncbi:MAG TPA: type III PLP-dependent enzyme [Candidatus Saccharimonadales bacterium]|nr:type III PLP-dependent enzyme [Candidatus Saccharimonadales bacterium]
MSNQAFKNQDLRQFGHGTPYFMFDSKAVVANLAAYKRALPKGTEICFAMKANSEEAVLKVLDDHGSSFEVASEHELAMLKKLRVDPGRIVYGTSVKPEASIAAFRKYGVTRYAFDSAQELAKIARQAPGAAVYLRVLVNDKAHSVFTMSEKFGTELKHAVELLVQARELGLLPYGISFNVGSQARNAEAWANGIRGIAAILKKLADKGIILEALNLGGGFPFSYLPGDGFPGIAAIGEAVGKAVHDLPYPIRFMAEPGRGLVADAYVLVVGVFADARRENGRWLYVDAGAYNALLETMAYQGSMRYRIELLRDSTAALEPCIVTGPTGDSLDVIDKSAMLPADVKVGDRLVVRDVGAYSFVLTTAFNGFPVPPTYKR